MTFVPWGYGKHILTRLDEGAGKGPCMGLWSEVREPLWDKQVCNKHMEDKHGVIHPCTMCGQDPASASPGDLLNMQHLGPVPMMNSECAFEQCPRGNGDYPVSVPTNTFHKCSDLLMTDVLALSHCNETPR